VHILLNQEFFAPGMAYVALSRARRLSQLHLWCLDLDAIHADPVVEAEYTRLVQRMLTDDEMATLPARRSVSLPPIATIVIRSAANQAP
jgi:hypothetical protein